MAIPVLLVAAILVAQAAVDTRLRPDWNDMVSAAAREGLILSGRADDDWASLSVRGVTITGAPLLPDAAIERLTLRRPIWNLFRLTVTSARPVTLVFHDGRQLDLWSRGIQLVRTGHRWRVQGEGIGAALHGGAPDDVTGIEAVSGALRCFADSWQLTLAASDVTLPAHGTWPNGRLVGRMAATLQVGTAAGTGAPSDTVPDTAPDTAPDAAPGRVALRDAEISWDGQSARLSFDGSLDDHGLLAGRGAVVLGPGWAATLKRAHAVGAISAGEAEAAIGFLGLLTPDERLPVAFPVIVDAGRVQVGRSTLFALPPFPAVR